MPDRSRLSSPVIMLVAVAAIGAAAPSTEARAQAVPQKAPPEVGTVKIEAKPVSLITELPGRTSAFRVADVRPQVSGVVLKRLFIEGDAVKAGQQLYQIDPAPYEASLLSAKATLARAKATVTSAQATVDRYRVLTKAQAVSRQDLDNAVATLQQAQADVASGDAAVKTAEINLAYTKVNSPISGRTSRSSVTEGALVTANQTTSLLTVTQLNPIYVDVTQPSATSLRLKRELAKGQIKTAGDNAAPVKLKLEDGSEYEQTGKLQFSEVSVDQGTGAVTLRALFPNDQGLLLPGMFVREELEEGVANAGLLVPQRGVTHNQRGEPTALVIGKDNKVELRVLVTDRAIGTDWLVSKGVNNGEQVIVEGLQTVHPGDTVTVKAVTASAAPAGTL
jgi:membrane fusion protein, multidrug efflux system